MASTKIFRSWHLRPKDYVFIWNSLVALHSYKMMKVYLAKPPSPSFLPSLVFGRCWVEHIGVEESKRTIEREHQELTRNAPGWEYGLWSMYFLFRTFERRTMYPLL